MKVPLPATLRAGRGAAALRPQLEAAVDLARPPEAAAERFWPAWAASALAARGSAGSTTLLVQETAGVLDGGDGG